MMWCWIWCLIWYGHDVMRISPSGLLFLTEEGLDESFWSLFLLLLLLPLPLPLSLYPASSAVNAFVRVRFDRIILIGLWLIGLRSGSGLGSELGLGLGLFLSWPYSLCQIFQTPRQIACTKKKAYPVLGQHSLAGSKPRGTLCWNTYSNSCPAGGYSSSSRNFSN